MKNSLPVTRIFHISWLEQRAVIFYYKEQLAPKVADIYQGSDSV